MIKTCVALVLLAAPAIAAAQGGQVQHAGFKVYEIETKDSGIGIEDASFIAVSPVNESPTTRQHRFQIMSNGQLGDVSARDWKQQKTHTHLILPVTTDIRYRTSTPGQLDVTTASGVVLRFRSGALASITDESGGHPCDITFATNPTVTERDYVINRCDNRIVFDTGLGSTAGAYANLAAKTKVTDAQGRSCEVANSVLFEPLKGRNTTADVKLKSQSRIYRELKALPKCAALDFGPIAPTRLGPDFLKGLSDH